MTVPLGASQAGELDPGDLSRLHDLALPEPIPTGLDAPGWDLLLPAVALALVVLAVGAWRRHRALGWRRQALAELTRLRSEGRTDGLPGLLKRAALTLFPREQVAALTGPPWWRFLDLTGGGGRFEAGAGEALHAAAYGGAAPVGDEALFEAARAWIRAQGPKP